MPHDDLFYTPSNVPSWARELLHGMAHLRKEIREMKQTTTDIVNAVNALVANSQKWDDALDAVTKAQDSSDDEALVAALAQLQALKADQDTHLNKLTTAIPPVVAAPADPTPVAINSPPTV